MAKTKRVYAKPQKSTQTKKRNVKKEMRGLERLRALRARSPIKALTKPVPATQEEDCDVVTVEPKKRYTVISGFVTWDE